jgi:hypothetical protein
LAERGALILSAPNVYTGSGVHRFQAVQASLISIIVLPSSAQRMAKADQRKKYHGAEYDPGYHHITRFSLRPLSCRRSAAGA